MVNSGKTSIVSLVERFYDVSRGQILFNDKDICSVNVGEYRKLISLVAQEPSLFQGRFFHYPWTLLSEHSRSCLDVARHTIPGR